MGTGGNGLSSSRGEIRASKLGCDSTRFCLVRELAEAACTKRTEFQNDSDYTQAQLVNTEPMYLAHATNEPKFASSLFPTDGKN